MNKNFKVYHLIFFIFFCVVSNAQREFVGALKLNDTLSITYRLNLKESNGKVTGYSITDIGGDYETRSNVHGEYNKNSKELNFRETEIVYTKTPLGPEYDFCHVNFTAKKFSFNKTKTIKGNFKGLFADYTECIDGELYLRALEKVEAKIDKVNKKINRIKRIPDSIKAKFNNIKFADSLKLNVLRNKEVLSMFSKSSKVNLILYDGGQEDGDIITLKCNGKTILNNFKVTRERKVVPITLENKISRITIIAVSAGTISANTAVIELKDDFNNIKALTNLKVGELTSINIIKK